MELVREFREKRYIIYNVGDTPTAIKKGLDLTGKTPLCGWLEINGKTTFIKKHNWRKITFDNLESYWEEESDKWGLRTGLQENGDYLIGLDFDMWEKQNGKYVECKNTIELYKRFESVNPSENGIFTSSTQRNRGVICDITYCTKIKELLSEAGSEKFNARNYCLEILNGMNMVLPPTTTRCKITKEEDRARKSLNNNYILYVHENREVHDFIIEYIEQYLKEKKKPKINKTKKIKNALVNYAERDENEYYIKNPELIKPFLKLLCEDRRENYNEWYKIGFCLKNAYGDAGLPLFIEFSKCKKHGEEVDETCKYHWNIWNNTENYEALTKEYILYCAKIDNEERYYTCLVRYELEKENEDLREKVAEFEKNVRKVLEPAVWMKKHRMTEEWDYCKWEDVEHCYKELGYSNNFMNSYLEYDNKNYYDTLDFIPDINFKEKQKNGYKIFNTFKGFESYEKVEIKPENREKYINRFMNHLRFMSDNDNNGIEMLLYFIINLIYDTLNKANICIVLKGMEGAGKTTIYKLLRALVGKNYCVLTPSPHDDICARFNDILLNKLFINVDEPDYNTFSRIIERFKELITGNEVLIEAKNKTKVKFKNWFRFLVTTNNDQLFKLSQTDRRFYFMLVSPAMVGQDEYFNDFYEMIENAEARKIILEYLKEIYEGEVKWGENKYCYKTFNFRHHQKNNKTKYHKSLLNTSKEPFYEFFYEEILHHPEVAVDEELSEINEERTFKTTINIKPIDFYEKWCMWLSQNKMKNTENSKTIRNKLTLIDDEVYSRIDNIRYYSLDRKKCLDYLSVNHLTDMDLEK